MSDSSRCHIVSQHDETRPARSKKYVQPSGPEHVLGTRVPTKYDVVELSNSVADRRGGQPSANEPCGRCMLGNHVPDRRVGQPSANEPNDRYMLGNQVPGNPGTERHTAESRHGNIMDHSTNNGMDNVTGSAMQLQQRASKQLKIKN